MAANKRGASYQGAVHKGRERWRRNFPTETEAKAWVTQSKLRLQAGQLPEMGESARPSGGKQTTLKELVQHVYETRWATQAGGKKQHQNVLDVIELIGPGMQIKTWASSKSTRRPPALAKTGIANQTVNRKLAALSTCLTEAREMEIITGKLVIKKLSFAEVSQRRFTPDFEAKALAYFDRVGHPEMADFVILALDTGMRESEVLSARFSDVQGGKVTVWGINSDNQQSKSRKTRTIPLTTRALAVIERRKLATNSDVIFHDLKKWSAIYWWGNFREAVGKTGQKDFKIHSLRHEFCLRLADKRVDAATIQKLAGHSSLSVTQRYINVSGASLEEAIRVLEVA